MTSFAICHGNNRHDKEGNEVGPHCPLLLYVSGGEFGVQAEQTRFGYEVTNFYADGVKGVNDDDMADAACDESPTCVLCMAEIHHWEGAR